MPRWKLVWCLFPSVKRFWTSCCCCLNIATVVFICIDVSHKYLIFLGAKCHAMFALCKSCGKDRDTAMAQSHVQCANWPHWI